MYTFAVMALMALAVVKLVDFLVDHAGIKETGALRSLLTFGLAIGAAWVIDYSMFAGWGIETRTHATGVWMTGFVLAGLTVPWRALFGYLTHDRATADETLGDHRELKKVA